MLEIRTSFGQLRDGDAGSDQRRHHVGSKRRAWLGPDEIMHRSRTGIRLDDDVAHAGDSGDDASDGRFRGGRCKPQHGPIRFSL